MAIYKEVPAERSRHRTTRAVTSDQRTKSRAIVTNFINYFKNRATP